MKAFRLRIRNNSKSACKVKETNIQKDKKQKQMLGVGCARVREGRLSSWANAVLWLLRHNPSRAALVKYPHHPRPLRYHATLQEEYTQAWSWQEKPPPWTLSQASQE